MLAFTTVALSISVAAADHPSVDHTRALTVVVFADLDPRLEVDFDRALSDKASVTAGVTLGRFEHFGSLLLRGLPGSPIFSTSQVGGFGSYNHHFGSFNRGWYLSGVARYDHVFATLGSARAGSYNRIAVGPAIGWKVATEGGFTFKGDLGLGYAAVFNQFGGTGDRSLDAPRAFASLGSLNLGYSF